MNDLAIGTRPGRRYRFLTGGVLRVALVGAGYVADFHLEALSETTGLDVVAICDPDRERAQTLARKWGVGQIFGSADELDPADVDLAHVLVPPDLHAPIARGLLERGIGVFLEKPLTLDSTSARELQATAHRCQVPLAVNHNNLYHPAFARLLDQVRAGRIGRLQHVQICWNVPLDQLDRSDFSHWMFQAPENILFEQAVHPLSQLHALIGPVRSAATTILNSRELHPGQVFYDRWLVAGQGDRGTAEIYLAFGQSFNRATVQVLGSDGSLEADLIHNLATVETKTVWLDFWNSFLAGWRRSRSIDRDTLGGLYRYARYTLGLGRRQDAYFVGMRSSIQDFYRAIRDGSPLPTGSEQAVEVLQWCEAAAAGIAIQSAVSRPTSPAPPVGPPAPARAGEVLVLGASGFIGRRVVSRLLQAGLPTTAMARRATRLPPALGAATERGELRLFPGTMSDRAALAQAVKGVRVVVHLATGGGATWDEVKHAMVDGSVALAEAALAEGVERFIYVSSIAALYAGADCGTDVIEDSPAADPLPERRDIYSRGKIAAEQALLALHRERGLPLIVVRPGVVLGDGTPMQHSGLGLWVRDNHCVGWGRGRHPLPLVWVEDVADALFRLVVHDGQDLDGRALNLCANPPLSAADVVAELRRVTGRDLHFHPRSLWLSQTLEIGKWLVKLGGRRPGAVFPSYRDLKSRALVPRFTSRTAREVLGWRPVEEREAFLDKAVRIYANPAR